MRLPEPIFKEVFNLRLTKKQKQLLEGLAKIGRHGKNCSAVLRALIESASRR